MAKILVSLGNKSWVSSIKSDRKTVVGCWCQSDYRCVLFCDLCSICNILLTAVIEPHLWIKTKVVKLTVVACSHQPPDSAPTPGKLIHLRKSLIDFFMQLDWKIFFFPGLVHCWGRLSLGPIKSQGRIQFNYSHWRQLYNSVWRLVDFSLWGDTQNG